MSITLTAKINCDHKNCSNTTTSDEVYASTYNLYGHEIAYIEIGSFDDKGWYESFRTKSHKISIKHYCPEHQSKQKKGK